VHQRNCAWRLAAALSEAVGQLRAGITMAWAPGLADLADRGANTTAGTPSALGRLTSTSQDAMWWRSTVEEPDAGWIHGTAGPGWWARNAEGPSEPELGCLLSFPSMIEVQHDAISP